MKKYLLILILCSSQLNAYYFVDTPECPVSDAEINGHNIKEYRDVCTVYNKKQAGTGTLVSPQVVVTSREIFDLPRQVTFGQTYTIVPSNNPSVTFHGRSYMVDDIILPDDDELNIALLILSEKITDIAPRPIEFVRDQHFLTSITLAGHGRGHAIYPENSADVDAYIIANDCAEIHQTRRFRYRKNFRVGLVVKNKNQVIFDQEHERYLQQHELWRKQKKLLSDVASTSQTAYQNNQSAEEVKAQYQRACESLETHLHQEPKLLKNLPGNSSSIHTPLYVVMKSEHVFSGQNDIGGPLLNENDRLIGINISIDERLFEIQQSLETDIVDLRKTSALSHWRAQLGLFMACMVPMTYMTHYGTELSWIPSTCVGGLSYLALNVGLVKIFDITSPMQCVNNHFYVKPYVEIIKKNDRAILEKLRQGGGFKTTFQCFSEGIHQWIEKVVSEYN